MPEVVACPKCQRKSRVPDSLMGKKVKCPGCSEVFLAAVNGPAPAPPRPKKSAAEDPGYEVVENKKKRGDDEDEAVSDKPRPRRAKDDDDEEEEKPRRSRARDDDDDDDDDRVTSRRNRYSRDRDDDDDDEDEDDDDDRPRRRRRGRRGVKADWPRIHRGLTLVLASVALTVIVYVVLFIGSIVLVGTTFAALGRGGAAAPVPGKVAGGVVALGAGIIILGIIGILGLLAALGLRVAGHVFCLPSPDAYGSKGLALATLILMLTNLGCTVLAWVISFIAVGSRAMNNFANPMVMSGTSNAAANVVSWIGALAGLAAFYVFLFYLRSLAQATGFGGLARSTVIYMITTVAGTVALFIVSCAGMALAVGLAAGAAGANRQGQMGNPAAALGTMGALGLVCGGVWIIYFLGMAIWWIMLVVQARNAVGTRVRDA